MAIFTVQGLERLIPEDLMAHLSQESVEVILADVADATRDFWVSEAMGELHSSKADYIHGLQPVELTPGQAVIALVGELPNVVEQGMDEKDMRDTLLGPNVPISPEGEYGKHLTIRETGEVGYYRSIPFRHVAPSSSGVSGKPMPKNVYQAAKKLRSRISDPYKAASWAEGEEEELKPKRLTSEYGARFAGMIRERKAYRAFESTPEGPKGRGVQHQYMTFRTISTLNKKGWIRPASTGKHFAEKAIDYAERSMTEALESFMEG